MITASMSPESSIASASVKPCACGASCCATATRSGLASHTAVSSRPSVAWMARLCSWPMAP